MQPEADANAWPKRLVIAGSVLFLIGTLLYFSNSELMNDIIDPRKSAQHSLEDGGIHTITLGEGCWVFSVLEENSDVTVNISEVNGSAIGDRLDEKCRADYDPQSTDGSVFTILGKWDVDKEKEVIIEVNCNDSCAGKTVWLNENGAFVSDFAQPMIIIMIGICCFGSFLIPLGLVLMLLNRSKSQPVLLENQSSMNEIDATEMKSTDEIFAMIHGVIKDAENEVPPPFSGLRSPEEKSQKVKSGSGNIASDITPDNPPVDDSWKKWDES